MRIGVLFVGELHDGGFNAIALDGVNRAGADLTVLSGVPYDQGAIRDRIEAEMAALDGLICIGGQGNRVMPDVAAAHPDKHFAVVQGAVTGANLASYDVRQEQSAYLAGCLAGLVTRTGTVGHLSGHRVTPGLKGRAAFVAGVRDTAPEVRVLTGFCGTQDDNAVVRDWADAQIAGGADVIFTMLNGARQGAIDACRAGGIRQIGNARDWTLVDPAVFLASAVARIDLGVERAIADMRAGEVPEQIRHFGLAEGDYAALSLAEDVPQNTRIRLDGVAARIRAGALSVPETYEGPEFAP
ncbi:Membrane lipoprotein TpN38(b) precursor (plasmid) [Paracoccaceae bacterium]|nr:Membrane lipoprotein TpN38(b) precursor [Paracoccaceae bacterium]